MRIEEIFVESFGAYRSVSIRNLGSGLTVIVGLNEAGKTTLLEFVRSVFFGFKRRSGSANTYETADGVPRRGWIGISTCRNGSIRISRNEQAGAKEGLLSVSDEKGATLDASTVPLFQAGLKKSVYESLFAFDLDQMRQLDQEALRGRIMAAALGSTPVNPLEVRKQLDERVKKLTRRSGKDPESLWAIQANVKELDKKLKLLGEKPQRYSDLKDELAAADTMRSDLYAELRAKEAMQRQIADIRRFEQDWRKLVALDSELKLLEQAAYFPANGLVRLEQCFERRVEAARDVQELEDSLGRLREQLAGLNPPDAFLRHGADIQSLVREAGELAAIPSHMQKLKGSIQLAVSSLTEEITGLGDSWSLERVRQFDPSLILEQGIRGFVSLWSESQENVSSLQPRLMETSERRHRLGERVQRNEAELQRVVPQCEGFLTPDDREKLRRWKEIKDRIEELHDTLAEKYRTLQVRAAEREDTAARIRSLRNQSGTLVAPAIFWALIVLFAAAATGMVFSASQNTGAAFYLFAALGALASAAVPLIVSWKMRAERAYQSRMARELEAEKNRYAAVGRDLVSIENERRLIRQRVQGLSADARNIVREALANPEADWEEVAQAELLASSAEEPARIRRILEDSVKFDRSDLEAEESRTREILRLISAAEQDFAVAKGKWTVFSAEKGLPPDMDPDSALELVSRLRDLKKRLPRILEEENYLLEMQRDWNGFFERALDLGKKLGDPAGDDFSPLDRAQHWSRLEREARAALSERKVLLERFSDHETRLNASRKRAEVLDDQVLALMEAAGVNTEESFRVLAELHERYRILERDRRLVIDGLVAGLGMADEHAMREHLQSLDWVASKDRVTVLEGDLKRLRHESEELATRSGMLMREIQTLEGEDETDRLLLQKEEDLALLKQSASEFIVAELASRILDKTVQLYEQEKQPKVLERSSQIFSLVTGNRYKRILFSLDGERIKVERSDGYRLDEDLLSRGTLEQMYLSLRLAHLDVYHRDKTTIPLLMDDVLVNFDPERAARTATALAEFSTDTGIQILFLTCHPHIASLFPEDVARITLQPSSTGRESLHMHQTGAIS